MASISLEEQARILSEKDSEKTEIKQSLDSLNAFGKEFIGKLHISVTKVEGLEGNTPVSLNVTITPSDQFASEADLSEPKKVEEVIKLGVKSADLSINYSCTFEDEGNVSTSSVASVVVNKLAKDMETTYELEVNMSESGKKLKLHIKAMYDTVKSLIKRKKEELQQIQKEIDTVYSRLQEQKKKSSPSSKKDKQRKSGKKNTSSTSDPSSTSLFTSSNVVGLLGATLGHLMMVPGLVANNRAVLLFGVSVVGIAYYGDMASV